MNARFLRWRWYAVAAVFTIMLAMTLFFATTFIARILSPRFYDVFPTIPQGRLTGRPIQALSLLRAEAAETGWTAARLALAGDLWQEAGNLRQALPYWEAAALLVTDIDTLRTLAETAIELGEWETAHATLQHLRIIEPGNLWAQFQIALLDSILDPSMASESLQRAAEEPAYRPTIALLQSALVDTDFSPLDARVRVGIALMEGELWAYADLALDYAAHDPALDAERLPEIFAYWGYARERAGKSGDDAMARAVRLAAENPRVRLFEGLQLRAKGDAEASLTAILTAVALSPEEAVYYAELGAAYDLMGDTESARYWIERAADFSDDDPRYADLLESVDGSTVPNDTILPPEAFGR